MRRSPRGAARWRSIRTSRAPRPRCRRCVINIVPVSTSIAAFVGSFARGPSAQPTYVATVADLESTFGSEAGDTHDAVVQFFANGGTDAWVMRGDAGDLSALDAVDVVSLLCLPDMRYAPAAPNLDAATAYCRARRAFFIADPPAGLTSAKVAQAWIADPAVAAARSDLAAVYFPDIAIANGRTVGASGAVAGLYARTQPWKAPAGQDAMLPGAVNLAVRITASESAALNAAGIDSIRLLPGIGVRVWGARTMSTDPEWRFVSVRRFALFLEASIDRALDDVDFEPNAIADFLVSLWRGGALAGRTPAQAFFVKTDTGQGIVNVTVGFAPLKPAEFVVIRIQKRFGQPPE
jgi:phage tail sheath protein FI